MSTTSRLPTPDMTGTGPVVPRVGHFVRETVSPAAASPAVNGNPARLTDPVPQQTGTGVAKPGMSRYDRPAGVA
jgi:hypothetical protein